MKLLRCAGRMLLGSLFVVGGYGAATEPGGRTAMVEKSGIDNAETLVRFNGGAQVLGGVALGLGILPRAAAAGLIASMVPTTIVGHPFWKDSDEKAKKMNLIQFLKNASIVGGLLMVVASKPATGCCPRAGKK